MDQKSRLYNVALGSSTIDRSVGLTLVVEIHGTTVKFLLCSRDDKSCYFRTADHEQESKPGGPRSSTCVGGYRGWLWTTPWCWKNAFFQWTPCYAVNSRMVHDNLSVPLWVICNSLCQSIKRSTRNMYIARVQFKITTQVLKLTPVYFTRVVGLSSSASHPPLESCLWHSFCGVKRTCWATGRCRCCLSLNGVNSNQQDVRIWGHRHPDEREWLQTQVWAWNNMPFLNLSWPFRRVLPRRWNEAHNGFQSWFYVCAQPMRDGVTL